MDSTATPEYATRSIDDFNSMESEAGSSKTPTIDCASFNGEVVGEVARINEVLTKVELDLACCSENLVNLYILMMNLSTLEGEFEAFDSEEKSVSEAFVVKAMEFDILSGVFCSDVNELDNILAALKIHISNARNAFSSCETYAKMYMQVEEKLYDSEKSLQQSQDQVSEMKMQSARFRNTLSCFGVEENWGGEMVTESLESSDVSGISVKLNMQTVVQQRHILSMLEKSLAREIELEKQLTESRQIEDELKASLYSVQGEVFYYEEEAMNYFERLLESDNTAEVFMGTSKELLGQLQIVQFNLKNCTQREDGVRSKLEDLIQQMNTLNSSFVETEDKLKLADSEKIILNKKIVSLEKESELRQQHAKASAEANEEKQNMMNSTIQNMENLIEDLKSKVSKYESHAESAEEKCIILSEQNEELNDELCFLRSKVECLEASRHKEEDTKVTTARDIGARTKAIANLVVQLAIERERLHSQISSLTKENKSLTVKLKLKQTYQDPSLTKSLGATAKEDHKTASVGEVSEINQVNDGEKTDTSETEVGAVESRNELEPVRRIDAGMLNVKYVIAAVFVLVISFVAAYQMKITRE